jgi:hypothetical protein
LLERIENDSVVIIVDNKIKVNKKVKIIKIVNINRQEITKIIINIIITNLSISYTKLFIKQ